MYCSHISYKFSLHNFILNLFPPNLTLKTISHAMMFCILQTLFSFFNKFILLFLFIFVLHSHNKLFYLNTCTLRTYFFLFKTQIIHTTHTFALTNLNVGLYYTVISTDTIHIHLLYVLFNVLYLSILNKNTLNGINPLSNRRNLLLIFKLYNNKFFVHLRSLTFVIAKVNCLTSMGNSIKIYIVFFYSMLLLRKFRFRIIYNKRIAKDNKFQKFSYLINSRFKSTINFMPSNEFVE